MKKTLLIGIGIWGSTGLALLGFGASILTFQNAADFLFQESLKFQEMIG